MKQVKFLIVMLVLVVLTAMDYAAKNGDEKIVKILESKS